VSIADTPRPRALLDQLRDELRHAPSGFVAIALAGPVVLLGGSLLEGRALWDGVPHPVVVDVLLVLLAAAVCMAPLVALRWPQAGLPLAVGAVALAVIDSDAWLTFAFFTLASVAVVAMWRSVRVSLLAAGGALAVIAASALSDRSMLESFGLDRYASPAIGPSAGEVVTTAVTVSLGLLGVLGFAYLMRSTVLVARRESAVQSRSTEVEGEATLVGERARLARDLHDVVAHHVSLIAVRAETAPYTCAELQPEAKIVLTDIATDARKALDELRGVLGILRRAEDGSRIRAPQPRLEDVAELVDTARNAGTSVRVTGDLMVPVGNASGYVAYRVVQEALTNARRHAPGSPVTLTVMDDGPMIAVRVANRREPSADTTNRAGGGLVGMRERVEALGGTLSVEMRGDQFVVEADLPRGEQ
jgi:signal transduction histidine kinase